MNYHFDGKKGLYDEIVRSAIKTMQTTTEAIRKRDQAARARSSFAYISIFLAARRRGARQLDSPLMMRELYDPTPALDLVMKQVVQPRMAYLREVLAVMFDCDPTDPRVERCVDEHSGTVPRAALPSRRGASPEDHDRSRVSI